MRSKLFIPASRPELFSKALVSKADALSFDLEDAVRDNRKADARRALAKFLDDPALAQSSKTVIVRVNPFGSRHFEDDIAAIIHPRIDWINLPKPDSAQTVRDVSTQIGALERQQKICHPGRPPIGLLLNIETPLSLYKALELAQADPRVVGLQVGLADMFEPYGIDRQERRAVEHVLLQTAFAAHAAGVAVFDGAFPNFADEDGLRAEASFARRLGFQGKSCIHPSQIRVVNEVFSPTEDEIAFAAKVTEAETQAQASGVGAFTVDGKMIDPPFVLRARAILNQSKPSGSNQQ